MTTSLETLKGLVIKDDEDRVLYPVSRLCVWVVTEISNGAQERTRNGAILFTNALESLKSRSLPLPDTLIHGNKKIKYISPPEIPKLVQGLVLDDKEKQMKVISWMETLLGPAIVETECNRIKDEIKAEEGRLAPLLPFLELHQSDNKIRTMTSRYSNDVIVAELYPMLMNLDYSRQSASEFFTRTAYHAIKVSFDQPANMQVDQTINEDDFCGLSTAESPVIVEHHKSPGCSKVTPYVSIAAMEFILARACPGTKKGQELLKTSLKCLGRVAAGDTRLAEQIVHTEPDPEVANFVLGFEEAELQREQRRCGATVLFIPSERRTRDNPPSLENIDESLGDLYAMEVHDLSKDDGNTFIAWKIGRSTDPQGRSSQLNFERARDEKMWTHSIVEIVRRSGCLEPIIHKHFSSKQLSGEYFTLDKELNIFRQLFDEALELAIPVWNEKQHKAREKALRLLGEDDPAAKRQRLDDDAYAERLTIETNALREKSTIEIDALRKLKDIEVAAAQHQLDGNNDPVLKQRRMSVEIKAQEVALREREMDLAERQQALDERRATTTDFFFSFCRPSSNGR